MSNVQSTKKTPQIRFNGFSEEWNENKINEIAEINPHSELPNIFEYVDLESVVGTEMVSHRTEKKDSAPSRAQRLAKKGDVFYQTVRPYQKNNFYFNRNDNNFVFSTGYAQLRSDFNGTFLLSVLQSKDFVEKVLENCTGTSYPAINPTTLGNLTIKFPNTNEQSKIGTFFSQIDSLITSTQKEHDKLVTLKKCMLQKMFPKKGSLVPEIRFKGFSGDWEEVTVNDLVEERNQQITQSELYPLMAFIAYQGVAPKGERYDRSSLVNDVDNKLYKITKYGDFIYSSNNLETGSIGLNTYGNAVISPVYSIFMTKQEVDAQFIGRLFVKKDFIKEMVKWRQGVIYGQWRIHESDFIKIKVLVPKYAEQQKIGLYFQNLDNLISKQAEELEKLKNVKKTLLSKMFV